MRIFLAFIFSGLANGVDVDFGWITPVHVADGKCFEASQRYIEAFGIAGDPRKNMSWGQYMLDADGRLPLEGFLSDTIPFPIPLCDILGPALPDCTQLPSFLTSLSAHGCQPPKGLCHQGEESNPLLPTVLSSSPELAVMGDKADFATKVRKSSINCLNVNPEQ